jgi:hypothetical protein
MTESKSVAEALFDLYADFQARRRDHVMREQLAVGKFVRDLLSYLGLEDTYNDVHGVSRPWIKMYDWNIDSASRDESVDSHFDLKTVNGEGRLFFALGLALSQAPTAFPKTYFAIPCTVTLDGSSVHMHFGEDEEYGTFDISSTGDRYDDALAAFVGSISQVLARGPFTKQAAEKRAFGFVS